MSSCKKGSSTNKGRLVFSKSKRLLKTAQFDQVFRARCSESDSRLIVYGSLNACPGPRLGLVVSRKCGNSVRRNLWKRKIREAFRLQQHQLPAGIDLVVLPRQGASPSGDQVDQSLRLLASRVARKLRGAPGRGGKATRASNDAQRQGPVP